MNQLENVKRDFKEELRRLINQYSLELDSNTPDFMLANYLCNQLAEYNKIVKLRAQWWGDPS